MIENYKDLKVWQKSYELCLDIYRITAKFPKEERYGLTSQIRRSVVSVPSLDPLNFWTLFSNLIGEEPYFLSPYHQARRLSQSMVLKVLCRKWSSSTTLKERLRKVFLATGSTSVKGITTSSVP